MQTTTTQTTCTFHWCESGHNDIQPSHESPLDRVRTVSGDTVKTAVNYQDGTTIPLLWLGASDAELDVEGVQALIAMLGRRVTLMQQIAGVQR